MSHNILTELDEEKLIAFCWQAQESYARKIRGKRILPITVSYTACFLRGLTQEFEQVGPPVTGFDALVSLRLQLEEAAKVPLREALKGKGDEPNFEQELAVGERLLRVAADIMMERTHASHAGLQPRAPKALDEKNMERIVADNYGDYRQFLQAMRQRVIAAPGFGRPGRRPLPGHKGPTPV